MVALMMSLGVPASAGLSIALMDRAISMTYNVAIGGRYASGFSDHAGGHYRQIYTDEATYFNRLSAWVRVEQAHHIAGYRL
jgi:hypothetical protein